MITMATGERWKQSGLMKKLAPMRPAPLSRQSVQAAGKEIRPLSRWRIEVRGLSLSKARSTMRLKAMAQVRAQTIASRIRPKVFQPGQPRWSRAATAMEARAKGRAKTVWEIFTNPAHVLINENIQHSTSNAQHPRVSRLRRKGSGGNPVTSASLPKRYAWRFEYLRRKCGLTRRTHLKQISISDHPLPNVYDRSAAPNVASLAIPSGKPSVCEQNPPATLRPRPRRGWDRETFRSAESVRQRDCPRVYLAAFPTNQSPTMRTPTNDPPDRICADWLRRRETPNPVHPPPWVFDVEC